MLFRPFDIGRWFAIGFSAWLAYLGQGGFNFRLPWGDSGSGGGPAHGVREACPANVMLIVFIVALAVLVGICIWLLLLWLSSRGRFMFLNCVARNTDKIKQPWRNYRTAANRLFLFQIVAVILFFVGLSPLIAVMVWCAILLSKGSAYVNAFIITAMVFLVLLLIIASIAFSIILKFTFDFVVPIMYIHGLRCIEAWGWFRSILSANKGRFTLYILFQIVIGLTIGAMIMTAVLATCCCAACVFAIPYIGTVVLLPLLVFERAYSVYYLRQYGDQFDVFAGDEISEGDMILEPQ
jgi:hypothetical protein